MITNNFEHILTYDISHITQYFSEKNQICIEDAKVIENEMKKYLYLVAKNQENYGISSIVDDYWHTFILFTESYHNFCKALGSSYIHHDPIISENQKDSFDKSFMRFIDDYKTEFGISCPGSIWFYNNIRCGSSVKSGNFQIRCGGRITI